MVHDSRRRRSLLAFVALAALLGAGPAGAQRQVRSNTRTNINQSAGASRSASAGTNGNRNANVNANQNVNVNRNVNVDVDNHWDNDGWDHPVAAGVAIGTAAAITAAAIGSIAYSLPPSCTMVAMNGVTYQQCGSTWYQPQYAGSQVTYVVVNPPH
ncbi:MAG TPA: hypothetical protein VGM86_18855 [Thermoanaerobaculia bacterium]|jgi:hypothetical protein